LPSLAFFKFLIEVTFRYATHLLSNNAYQRPRNGQNDDQAHPPITPCKAVDPNSIENPIERSIYILVVKHYLACCSKDAVGKETTLTVQMGSEDFFAKGLMILERNWLEIYAPWERWSTGQGQLPPLEVGSRITPSAFMLQDGRTVPPRLLTEAELIALMDRNGIGTDATIATHIQTIQDRGYATKNAQQEFSPTKLGIALVEGYNSMGYQLNKPDLRREMERECNLVASGQKTMESIMGPIISKMKECFEHASAEAHKLDAAVGRHFSSLGQVNAVILKARLSECGICQNFMALKEIQPQQAGSVNQKRKIAYCEICSLGLPLPKANEINPATELENGQGPAIKCPICQYQVLRVMASTGSTYSVCPKCYSDPPEDHGGDPTAGETFPCFKCRHPTCSLAQGTQGGDVSLFGCPFCIVGKITLRRTTRGSFALSCNNYSGGDRCTYSVWLPNEARIVSVPEGENKLCRRCSIGGREVHLLHFKWKPGSVPLHMGHEFQGCILCDSDFRRDMNIRLPQANQVMIPPQRRVVDRNPNSGREHGRGRDSGRNRRVRGTSNTSGRGNNVGLNIVCFRCNQPGHFANACPQGQ
jgi:DNA topoisomerase III